MTRVPRKIARSNEMLDIMEEDIKNAIEASFQKSLEASFKRFEEDKMFFEMYSSGTPVQRVLEPESKFVVRDDDDTMTEIRSIA